MRAARIRNTLERTNFPITTSDPRETNRIGRNNSWTWWRSVATRTQRRAVLPTLLSLISDRGVNHFLKASTE